MEVQLRFGMVIGIAIAVALGLSSIKLLSLSGSSLASVSQTLFPAFEGCFTLPAIPLFNLASTFMSTGGVVRRIICYAVALGGHFQGGLAIASVLPA